MIESSDDDLAVTLAPLMAEGSGSAIKTAFDQIASLKIRHVQIGATTPGLRPRDLDATGRRDLLANMRRREIVVSGLDAWIPVQHFDDPARVDRAVTAVKSIIALAADLGRVPVNLVLPVIPEIVEAIVDAAFNAGVELADHALKPSEREGVGVGIDPAAYLANGRDPIAAVHALHGRLIAARLVDLMRVGTRGPIGIGPEGQLDTTGYKVALSVNSHRRPVIIDARTWSRPWEGVDLTAKTWRALL